MACTIRLSTTYGTTAALCGVGFRPPRPMGGAPLRMAATCRIPRRNPAAPLAHPDLPSGLHARAQLTALLAAAAGQSYILTGTESQEERTGRQLVRWHGWCPGAATRMLLLLGSGRGRGLAAAPAQLHPPMPRQPKNTVSAQAPRASHQHGPRRHSWPIMECRSRIAPSPSSSSCGEEAPLGGAPASAAASVRYVPSCTAAAACSLPRMTCREGSPATPLLLRPSFHPQRAANAPAAPGCRSAYSM